MTLKNKISCLIAFQKSNLRGFEEDSKTAIQDYYKGYYAGKIIQVKSIISQLESLISSSGQ